MKKYFITFAYNKNGQTYYENLTLECDNAAMKFFYNGERNRNVFTDFVFQYLHQRDKLLTVDQCLSDYPIVNIFELCM